MKHTTVYRYETHVHTSEVSLCGKASAAEQVRSYAERGYAGLCITDHFFKSNIGIPTSLSWAEQVEQFCLGYENARRAAEPYGLSVFFGWEYAYKIGTHVLTYGLDPAWLLHHPEVTEMNLQEYCRFVRAEGGLLIHAHPFREASYIDIIRLFPYEVDAVEIVNTGNHKEEWNTFARQYAENYHLIGVGGSDNHAAGARTNLAGIETDTHLETVSDFISTIKNRRFRVFTHNFEEDSHEN